MSIKKLYKITKTTPLSKPAAKKMGIARIFSLIGNSKLVTGELSCKVSNQLHLRRKDKKKYGRIKKTQLQQI